MNFSSSGFIWQRQSSFVVIVAGATLSLSDFLIFPTLSGQNGGGAFVLIYLLFLGALGLPLLMSEFMLGRLSQSDPVHCFERISLPDNAPRYWKLAGLSMLLASFLIVSMMSVIAGWSMSYLVKTSIGVLGNTTAADSGEIFNAFIFDSERALLWHTLFVILLVSITAQPARIVFEKMMQILVSLMVFIILGGLGLAFYATDLEPAVRYLLFADFSAIDAKTLLLALQRAFYTLALGLGVMIALGRFLPKHVSIGYSAALVIAIDLLLSLLVALMINAIIISTGTLPRLDYEFMFQYLPSVYGQFEYSELFGVLFFALMLLGALTTAMALSEGPGAYLERKFQISRQKARIFLGIGIWLIGSGVVFSYAGKNGDGVSIALFYGDKAVRLVNNAGFHDVLIFTASHLIQPIMALLLCLYAGWVIPRRCSFKALRLSTRFRFELWSYMVRYVTPVLMLCVVLEALGVI